MNDDFENQIKRIRPEAQPASVHERSRLLASFQSPSTKAPASLWQPYAATAFGLLLVIGIAIGSKHSHIPAPADSYALYTPSAETLSIWEDSEALEWSPWLEIAESAEPHRKVNSPS